MKTKKKTGDRPKQSLSSRVARELEGAAGGAITGAALGAAAGPPGLVAGAILGAAAGTAVAAALETEASQQSNRTRTLDAEIGVTQGSLGAPNLLHPPATVGAYSASSSCASSSSPEPAEGPFQVPED